MNLTYAGIFSLFLFSTSAFAASSSTTFSVNGYLGISGTGATGTHTFVVYVHDGANCAVYTENQSFTFSGAAPGYFALQIGTGTSPAWYGAANFAQAFDTASAGLAGKVGPTFASGCTTLSGSTANWKVNITIDGSFAMGDVPVTATPLASVADNANGLNGVPVNSVGLSPGNYLQYNGTNWVPAALSVSAATGTLPISAGGTGQTSAANAINALLPTQTSGMFLTTNGTNVSWAAPTTAAAGATNSIQYNNAGALGGLTLTNGQLLIGSTGLAPVAATLLGTANEINVATGAGSITLSTPQAIATSSSPSFTGMTLSGFGTGVVHSSAAGLLSSASVSLISDVSGTLPVANGGTGAPSLTANGLLLGNGAGAVTAIAPVTAGQVLTSQGVGSAPVWAAPGAASNVPLSGLTNATGSPTLANANFAQVWNWDTLTTGTAMTMASASMTSGSVLALTDSFNNATSTGSILNVSATGVSSAATGVNASTAGTGAALKATSTGTGYAAILTGANGTTLKIVDTNQAAGKVLTSDAAGNASWQTPSGGGVTTVATAANYVPKLSTASQITNSQIYDAGSAVGVGIGTLTPTASLEIDTVAGPSAGVIIKNQGSLSNLQMWEASGGGVLDQITNQGQIITNSGSNTAANPAFAFSNATGPGFFSPGANTLGFATTGLERLRIDASGNVGIGTTTPTSTLQVSGTAEVDGNFVVKAGGLIGINNSAPAYGVDYNVANSSVYTSTGPGTAPLGGGFEIYNTTATDSTGTLVFLKPKNTAANFQEAYIGAVSNTAGYAPSIVFGQQNGVSSYSESMRLDQSGRLGIGTTSPAGILDLTSTTSGLLIPRMTTAQKNAISTPAVGLQVYDTNQNSINYYNGGSWQALGVAGAGVTSLTAGAGLTGGTITTSGTIGLGTELTGLNGLASIGLIKRTGAGAYSAGLASLTTDVSGSLPIANGGTNSALALNNNRMMVSSGGAITEAGALNNGQVMIGSTGAAPAPAFITGTANQVTVTNSPNAIGLSLPQNIHTGASPTFSGATLTGLGTGVVHSAAGVLSSGPVNLSTDVAGIISTGNLPTFSANSALTTNLVGAITASAGTTGSIFTMSAGSGPTWTTASYPLTAAVGTLLYGSGSNVISTLAPAANGNVLTIAGGMPTWQTPGPASNVAFSGLTPAVSGNTIDNLSNAQTWNWSTATTQSPLSITANLLTTGTALNLMTSSASLNSTNGLLNVANTGASSSGVLARFQANSTVGSGMNLLTNGNVGIGTTSPNTQLDVAGSTTGPSVSLRNGIGATSPTVRFADSTNSIYGYFGWNPSLGAMVLTSGSSGTPAPIIFNNQSTEYMRITNTGSVGIGLTTPSADLQVYGPAAFVTAITSTPSVRISATGTTAYLDEGTYSGGYPYIQGNNNGTPMPVLINPMGSNVGIGTASPVSTLDVGGYISVNGKYLAYHNGSSASTVLSGTSFFQIVDSTNSTNLFTVTNAGNVGIGTTTPGYKLHVIGSAGLSSGTSWINASDARLKDIQGDYQYGLDEVLKLHTVNYNYKKDNALGLPSDLTKTGFIAQEVQKVIPEAVSVRQDGYLEINVDPIHWAVVNAVKDLYNKYILHLIENDKKQDRDIAALKEENLILKKENADFKSYLCAKDPSAAFCK